MNWEAIGAIGEVIGAAAVLVTLIILVIQLRQNNRSLLESNQLNRAATVDRHAETVSRWRGRVVESAELSKIWLAAINDEKLDQLELYRLNNLWIDFVNTQRSNYVRSITVGEMGLSKQAVRSVAVETIQSSILNTMWQSTKPWHKMVSEDFVDAVDAEIKIQKTEWDRLNEESERPTHAYTIRELIQEQEKEQKLKQEAP